MNQEKVWDAIARPWKEFRHYEVSHIINFLKDKTGRVLDLGCGSGRNLLQREDLEFYGIDFSQSMVNLAKERGIAKEIKKAEVSAIPYGDEFFDYIIFSAVLHCVDSVEKRKKALEESYRVLKSGGEMLISVWGRGSKRVKNRPKECLVPWSANGGKEERYTYIYDKKELENLLKDVGFEIISSEENENIVVIVKKLISS